MLNIQYLSIEELQNNLLKERLQNEMKSIIKDSIYYQNVNEHYQKCLNKHIKKNTPGILNNETIFTQDDIKKINNNIYNQESRQYKSWAFIPNVVKFEKIKDFINLHEKEINNKEEVINYLIEQIKIKKLKSKKEVDYDFINNKIIKINISKYPILGSFK